MNNQAYVGRPLRDLVNDIPSYAMNYYLLYRNDKHYLKDCDEECLSKIIKKIEIINDTGWFSYPITLE